MLLALSIFVFFSIAVIVFAFGAAASTPSSILGSRLREIGWQRSKAVDKPAIRERMQQALDPLSRALPVSPSGLSQTRAWLIQAGYRSPQHATIYNGLRVLCAGLGFISVFLFTGFDSPLLLAGITALGFFLPRFMLKKKLAARQRRIRLGLPDGLDLTVICVEAGLSLDQAMMRVGEDLRTAHPELSAEFHLFDLEARAGKPRVEALHPQHSILDFHQQGVARIKSKLLPDGSRDNDATVCAQRGFGMKGRSDSCIHCCHS